jgi:ATP-binding cassette subfamily B protein
VSATSILDRFPALHRLERRRREIPVVRQLEWSDCGAACVAMVLGYHGSRVSLDRVKASLGSGRDGSDALGLLTAAEGFGLRGRGLRIEPEDLAYLKPASILHWDLEHFVVFERLDRRGAWIVDPRRGRRHVSHEELSRAFTGVALELEPTDAFTPIFEGPSRLQAYFGQLVAERPLMVRVVVMSLMLRVLALALPMLTGLIVDRVVPRGDVHLLAVIGVGLVAALAFRFTSQLIRAHLLLQLRTNLDTRMTLGFLDHLVSLPLAFFQRRSTGDLMLRVSGNASMREILTSNTLSGLLDGTLVVVYLGLIVLASPALAAIVLALGTAELAVFLATSRTVRDLMARDLDAQASAHGYLAEMMAGIESLKLAGVERRAVSQWSSLFVDELNVSLQRGRLAAWTDALRDLVQGAGPLILIGYGALEVMDGALSLGTMLATTALAFGVLAPLGSLVGAALAVQTLHGYLERLDDVLRTTPERSASAQAPPQTTGRVDLSHVSFRYGLRGEWVVRDVSLSVAPGSTVALVGRSGSGKSTLASLMLGLYEPTEGRILYDDRDLAELDLVALRRQLGVVPQHPRLFSGTVRENLALHDPSISQEDIVRATRLACIHDDITAMPLGYDTLLADGGSTLSGGQRQRLALARALVRRPAILLLDEATSALDVVTERAVSDALDGLACTRIVIAHRLSTIARADLILVMDDGRIVEHGAHRELMARGGVYTELVAQQVRLVPSSGADR